MATSRLRAIPPGDYGGEHTVAPPAEGLPLPLADWDSDFTCGRCGILLLRGTGSMAGEDLAAAPPSSGRPVPLLRCPACGWDNELPQPQGRAAPPSGD